MLGAADATLRTVAGRTVAVRTAVAAANGVLDGRLSVGAVGGSLRHGLEARDVVIEGADGEVLAKIPALSLRYRLRDLLRGRVVLGQLRLEQPYVNLVQARTGRLNLEDIFGMGKPGGGGRPPLVAFSDVEIAGATLCIRTQADSASGIPEGERGPAGYLRVRRIEDLDARLSYLRLSSPLPAERAIRVDVADLRGRVSDPVLDIRGLRGTVELDGRVARLDLAEARLPHSHTTLKGSLSWPHDTLLMDLAGSSRDADVDDIRGLAPGVPTGLRASGAYTLRSLSGSAFAFGSERITVSGKRPGSGSFTGRLGFVLGPGDEWASSGTDVTLSDFDLEYVRSIFDTMPVAGRLSGTLAADGPRGRLSVSLDWAFRDSLVSGRPESQIRGHGIVSIGVPEKQFVFRGFAVEQSRIDLATVRRMLPAVDLRGILSGSGTLNGPWLEAEFGGTLRHRDAPLPASVARGVIRVDARRDTLGVWATLAWDSLQLGGLRTSYPDFAVTGAFGGETRLGGYADSLTFTADLSGPAGRFAGTGVVTLVTPHRAVHGLELALRGVSLAPLHPDLPPTRLYGHVSGDVEVDTLRPPSARLAVLLDTSTVSGSRVDSLRGILVSADSTVGFEHLGIWAGPARLDATGGLGFGTGAYDSLAIAADADLLGGVEPFVRWLLSLPPDTARGGPAGSLRVRASLAGRLDDFRLQGDAAVPRLRWGTAALNGARVSGEWRSTARTAVRLDWTADTAALGGYALSGLDVGLAGRRDSLGWRVTARMGDTASVAAAGRAHGDSLAVALLVDSLTLGLPVYRWRADTGGSVVWTDTSLYFRGTRLVSGDGGAAVRLDGGLPLGGAGQIHTALEQVPLQDLLALLEREYRDVDGQLSGSFDVAGLAQTPVMHGAFSLVNGVYGDFHAPLAEGTLDYADRLLKGTVSLRRLGERVLVLNLDLPLDLALSDVPTRQWEGPLSIRGTADSVDLAFAEALTPQVRRASGQMDADVAITGTWTRPQLAGSVKIIRGAASFPSLGVRHEGLNGTFTLVGDTIRVDELSLRSVSLADRNGRGGTLSVSGFVRLEELAHPVLGLRLAASEFNLLDVRNFLAAVVTGNVDLRGPVFGARLSGSGTITKGVVYFADLITKQVVNLQDAQFRDVIQDTSLIRTQGLGPEFHNRFWDSLSVGNLALTMGTDVRLVSNEANIQLEGSVQVAKDANVYRLDGTLSTPRGTYRLQLVPAVTREFTVTGGQVQYFGTPDLNAALDVTAQHVVKRRSEDDVTVTVTIGGTLYVPRLTLSSNTQPPLSDPEIISLLLFGTRTPEQVATAGAGSQVNFALAQLSGVLVGAGNALVSNLNIPLQISLRASDVSAFSGTEIALGKQVDLFGAPLFLTGSQRVCKDANGRLLSFDNIGASLEYRLTGSLRIAASLDPVRACGTVGLPANVGRQAGIDLFWEKRF